MKADNKSPLNIRWLYMSYLAFLFFILYGSVNQYTSLGTAPSSFIFEWEKSIPFVEEWILPYTMIYPMFILAFLLPQSNRELTLLAWRSLIIILFSVLIFLFFPLAFSFTKPETEHFNWFLEAIELVDLPYNQAPSLHVSFSVVLWFSLAKRVKAWWGKALLALLFFTIAISTLFVYQHHFIDVSTGALVGVLSCYFIGKKSFSRLAKVEDLKKALFLLTGSLLAVVLYFHVSFWFGLGFLFLLLWSVGLAFLKRK